MTTPSLISIDERVSLDRSVQFLLMYVGAAMLLQRWIDVTAFGVSLAFSVSVVLALGGWRQLLPRVFARYVTVALLFAVSLMVSAVASWNSRVLYASFTLGIVSLFVVPGLGRLLQDARNLYAIVLGLMIGSTVFLVTWLSRVATGASIYDEQRAKGAFILGSGRNTISLVISVTVPLVFAVKGKRLINVLRWPFALVSAVWLISTGGRAALGGALVAVIVYWLLLNGSRRKVRFIVIGLIIAVFVLSAGGAFGAPLGATIDRARGFFSSDDKREDSDDVRSLLGKKAWALTASNPVFGVGLGTFEGRDHPVLAEAESSSQQMKAIVNPAHNTYLELSSTAGIPAALLFVVLLVTALVAAARRSEDPACRLAAASLTALAVNISFSSVLGSLVFFPIAIALGVIASGDLARPAEAGAPPAGGAR